MSEENKQKETENGKDATENEQEELGQIANQALRGPKFGVFEQLICQHLVQATVTSDSLLKIHFVTDAALMLDADKAKSLEIDTEKLEAVKVVCDALRNKSTYSDKKEVMISVRFGFDLTEESYNRFIEPFWEAENRKGLYYYPNAVNERFGIRVVEYNCRKCHSKVGDSSKGKTGYNGQFCVYCGQDLKPNNSPFTPNPGPYITTSLQKFDAVPYWEFFFEVCRVLSPMGYIQLQNSFLKWAMPFTMDLMRRLTKAVRPEIYNQIAAMFISAKKEVS